MNVDFGLTAHDYARHRAGFPGSFLERVAAFGIGTQGHWHAGSRSGDVWLSGLIRR